MNKKFWRYLTFIGLFLAVIAFGMILVVRLHLGDFIRFGGESPVSSQQLTQQASVDSPGQSTQETDLVDPEADRKNLQRFVQSCFPDSDCVHSITKPKFVTAKLASRFLSDDDMVIGVAFQDWEHEDDPVKAYPVKILNWHEVVNDFVNENPVIVTYSALSMTPRVYSRPLEGKLSDFDVSEMVLNDTPVLYDTETKSYWNQFDGSGLTGSMRDSKLQPFLSPTPDGFLLEPVLVKWSDWVKTHPATLVLSEDTGFAIDYDKYPYGDYQQTSDVYFPLENSDERLKPKEPVFGIVVDGKTKAYPQGELIKAFARTTSLTDEFNGKKLTLKFSKNVLQVSDADGKVGVPNVLSYYFVWKAFYPDTEIFIYHPPAPEVK